MTRKHTARTAFAVAGTGLLTAAGLAMAAPSAYAEDAPTARELLDQCDNGTDTCDFHPAGAPEEYTGAGHQVGDSAYNCTPDLQRSTVNWSDTTGESNSFGVSLSAEYGFSEVFKVSIEVSYNHTWESSHTEGQATNVDVRPVRRAGSNGRRRCRRCTAPTRCTSVTRTTATTSGTRTSTPTARCPARP